MDAAEHPLADLEAPGADMPPAFPPRLVDDPDLVDDEAGPSEAVTPLEELRAEVKAELAAPVERAPVTLKVPGRPGYAVRLSTIIDDEAEFQRWHRKASKQVPGRDAVVDRIKLAGFALTYKCEAIVRHGSVFTDGGEPVVFRSPAFLELMQREGERRMPDVRVAIRRFYGVDADMLSAAEELFARAGYGDAAEEADELGPTGGR